MAGILPRRLLTAVAVLLGAHAGSASSDEPFVVLGLLTMNSVAAELGLNQVQMGGARVAIREARLGKKELMVRFLDSLAPTQLKVLEQMSVQRTGFRSLLDPALGRRVGIGKGQIDRLREILKYYDPAPPEAERWIQSGVVAGRGGPTATDGARRVQAWIATRMKYRDRLSGEVRRVIGAGAYAKFIDIRGPVRPFESLRVQFYELLQQVHVQEELRMSPAQARRTIDELRGRAANGMVGEPVLVQVLADRALALLTPAQRIRLRELACQKLGPAAIATREVAVPLKLTHEQFASIMDVAALSQVEAILDFNSTPRTPAGLKPPTGQYERTVKAKEAREKRFRDGTLAILTPAQRKQWTQMLGQPMKTKPLPAGL